MFRTLRGKHADPELTGLRGPHLARGVIPPPLCRRASDIPRRQQQSASQPASLSLSHTHTHTPLLHYNPRQTFPLPSPPSLSREQPCVDDAAVSRNGRPRITAAETGRGEGELAAPQSTPPLHSPPCWPPSPSKTNSPSPCRPPFFSPVNPFSSMFTKDENRPNHRQCFFSRRQTRGSSSLHGINMPGFLVP